LTLGQMDATIQERVVQKENELNATYDERMRNYEERFATNMLCVRVDIEILPENRTCGVKSLS
jgi:hypothetical protein